MNGIASEVRIPVNGFVLLATRNERGELVPCELRDSNERTLNCAAAIVAFGGASYGQALNRALRAANTELDEPIPFGVTDAGWREPASEDESPAAS